MGALNLAGLLSWVSGSRTGTLPLSPVQDGVEVKTGEITIPTGGAEITIPLNLSTGITEALVVALYAAKTLTIEWTSSDATTPGPVREKIKGPWYKSLAPDGGLVTLKATNDGSEDVQLVYVFGTATSGQDTPDYWTDLCGPKSPTCCARARRP